MMSKVLVAEGHQRPRRVDRRVRLERELTMAILLAAVFGQSLGDLG
jgi:hypothetical protein